MQVGGMARVSRVDEHVAFAADEFTSGIVCVWDASFSSAPTLEMVKALT